MARYEISEDFLSRIERLQSILKNNLAGMFGGGHQSKRFGASCEFSDYRDYLPGDDVSKIDWNAYARFDELYLKLYRDERRLHTRIYIDISRSMEFGRKAECALEVAATLAYLSVCELDNVTIYTISNSHVNQVLTINGKDAFFGKITELNNIEFGGELFLSDALLPQNVGYGDGLSVVISDFLTDADYESAFEHFASKKRDLLCFQILSQEEIRPQIRGKNHLFDAENPRSEYRKNITRDVINAYKEAVEFVKNRLRNFCSSRGGVFVSVVDDKPVDEIFFNDLVMAEVLK